MSTVDDVRDVTGATQDTQDTQAVGLVAVGVGQGRWVPVCRLTDLVPERGAAALVEGQQVALFRLVDDTVHAVGNRDPFSGAQVLARGIVGTRGEAPVVTGPLYKQHFDLRTGACLEEPATRVPVHAVRVEAGVVHVALAVGTTEVDLADGRAAGGG